MSAHRQILAIPFVIMLVAGCGLLRHGSNGTHEPSTSPAPVVNSEPNNHPSTGTQVGSDALCRSLAHAALDNIDADQIDLRLSAQPSSAAVRLAFTLVKSGTEQQTFECFLQPG